MNTFTLATVIFFLRKNLQRAKKVVSHGLGLVDLAIGLVKYVFNLPDGQVMFKYNITGLKPPTGRRQPVGFLRALARI